MKTGLQPIVSPRSTTLILGTMPGDRSIASGEYYANKGNQFRKLLFGTFGEPYRPGYAAFLELLERRGIALWNVLKCCEREGSSDSAIRNAEPNDLEGLLKNHPSIEKICFESQNAQRLFDRYHMRMPQYRYHSLPSASGLFAKMSFSEKLAAWQREIKM